MVNWSAVRAFWCSRSHVNNLHLGSTLAVQNSLANKGEVAPANWSLYAEEPEYEPEEEAVHTMASSTVGVRWMS